MRRQHALCLVLGGCVASGCRSEPRREEQPAASTPAAAALSAASAAPSDVPRAVRGALTTELVPEAPRAVRERLARYLDVRRADFAGWDYGGEGLYVLTRLANVNQLHRVDTPLGMRRQLTFGSEGVDGFVAARDAARRGGVLSADERGNEG